MKTELRMMLSMFKAAESIRQVEKYPLQWILEEVQASKMEEGWKDTMTPKSLRLLEKESVAKPKPKSQVRKAWRNTKRPRQRRRWLRDNWRSRRRRRRSRVTHRERSNGHLCERRDSGRR